jgi:hypothetical protein
MRTPQLLLQTTVTAKPACCTAQGCYCHTHLAPQSAAQACAAQTRAWQVSWSVQCQQSNCSPEWPSLLLWPWQRLRHQQLARHYFGPNASWAGTTTAVRLQCLQAPAAGHDRQRSNRWRQQLAQACWNPEHKLAWATTAAQLSVPSGSCSRTPQQATAQKVVSPAGAGVLFLTLSQVGPITTAAQYQCPQDPAAGHHSQRQQQVASTAGEAC